MEKMKDLKALLRHEVQDLISVEDQIIEAMPLMIESSQSTTLKKSLQEHLAVTEKQRARLDEVQTLISGEQSDENKGFLSGLFKAISGGEKCKGMEGIITEGQKIIKADMDADVKDAAIIAYAQKIEHYEICGYGTVRAYAMELGLIEAEKLLQQTLDEEYFADGKLTQLALGGINEKAETTNEKEGASGSKSTSRKKSNTSAKKAAPANKNAEVRMADTVNRNQNAPKKVAAKTRAQGKKTAVKTENEPAIAPAKTEAQPKKAAVKNVTHPKKAASKKTGNVK